MIITCCVWLRAHSHLRALWQSEAKTCVAIKHGNALDLCAVHGGDIYGEQHPIHNEWRYTIVYGFGFGY